MSLYKLPGKKSLLDMAEDKVRAGGTVAPTDFTPPRPLPMYRPAPTPTTNPAPSTGAGAVGGFASSSGKIPVYGNEAEYKPNVNNALYQYINNPAMRKPMTTPSIFSAEYDNGGDFMEKYQRMRPGEVKMYNTLYHQDPQKASNYLSDLDLDLNKRQDTAHQANMAKMGKEHPVLSSIGTVAQQPLAGPLGALDLGAQNIRKAVTGKPVDYHSPLQTWAKTTGSIRSGASEDMGKAGKFLYNTAMSGADSLLASAAPGGFVSLGLSAGADAARDIHERGGSDNQALLGGIAAGAFEGIFEKFSIGQLKSMKEIPVSGIKDIVANVGKSTVTNFSEESATELANIIFDTLQMGDRSNAALMYRNLVNSGMSEAEAKKQTAINLGKQIGEAGLSGALMGAAFGGIGSGLSAMRGKSTNVDNNVETQEHDAPSPGMVQKVEAPTVIAENATTSADDATIRNDRTVPAGPVTHPTPSNPLYNRDVAPIPENVTPPVPTAPMTLPTVVGTHIDDRGVEDASSRKVHAFQFDNPGAKPFFSGAAADLEQDMGNYIPGERFPTYDDYGHITGYTGTKRSATAPIVELKDTYGMTKEQIYKAIDDIKKDQGSENNARAKKLEFVLDDMLSNGYTDSEGRWHDPDPDYLAYKAGLKGKTVEETQEAEREPLPLDIPEAPPAPEGYGYQALRDELRQGVSAEQLRQEAEAIRAAGDADMANLYEMGAMYGADAMTEILDAKIAEENEARPTVPMLPRVFSAAESGLDAAYIPKTLNRRDRRAIDGIGKKLGVKVKFLSGEKSNGYYENGTIFIADDAEDPVGVVLTHEATHRMQALSPAEYKAYRDYAVQTYGDKADAIIRSYQEHSAAQGVNLTEEGAMDEIAADYTAYLLKNSESFRRLAYDNRSVAQKILDAVRDVIARLRGTGNRQGEAYGFTLGQLEEAERLWSETMKAAENAAQNPGTGTEGGRQYSFAGTKAAGANLEALDEANAMEQSGADAETIRRKTGWFRGADKQWRFEIDDSGAKFYRGGDAQFRQDHPDYARAKQIELDAIMGTASPEDMAWLKDNGVWLDEGRRLSKMVESGPVPLRNVVSHPELYSRYPKLAKIRISFEDSKYMGNAIGAFDPNRMEIKISDKLKANPDELLSTVMHEIQHAIQNIEGFSSGSSTEYWDEKRKDINGAISGNRINLDLYYKDIGLPEFVKDSVGRVARKERTMDEHWKAVQEFKDASKYARQIANIENHIKDLEKEKYPATHLGNGEWGTLEEMYMNTAGEIEARDTEKRLKYSPEQRRDTSPNTGDEKTVFADRPGTSMSRQNSLRGVRRSVEEDWNNLVNSKTDFHAKGEKAYRDIQVPTTDMNDRRIPKSAATVMEAEAITDEAVKEVQQQILDGSLSFTRNTDKGAMERAEGTIRDIGWDGALERFHKDAQRGVVSKDDMALGATLLTNAAQSGDMKAFANILVDYTSMSRAGAQATQANRLLKKMSPTGQLYGIQRSVQNLQEELAQKYKDKAPNIKIPDDLAQKFMEAPDQKGRDAVMEEIWQSVADQVPARWQDKWNAWRYLAMLGNPRTHVRNIVGNAGFTPVRMIKDAFAYGIESVTSKVMPGGIERTKSVLNPASKADRALMSACMKDANEQMDLILGEGKYRESVDSKIRDRQTIFTLPILEKARKANSAAMDIEDTWFSKPAYAGALAGWLKAHKLTMQTASPQQLDQGRAYAAREAQRATYRDSNALSDAVSQLNRLSKSNNKAIRGASKMVEGVLPFKKTPANILMRGVEYSPIGLVKGMTADLAQVKAGTKTAAEAIDNISAGLTGTGLLALGFFLAKQGLLSGGAGDEDERNQDRLEGGQPYALNLGGKSFTLDWLAPEALPLFVGVEIYNNAVDAAEPGARISDNISRSIQSISNPMLEMSMLQGLQDAIDSVSYSENKLASMISSSLVNYVSQGLPTLFGQIERTGEDERKSTFVDRTSPLSNDLQRTLGKISGKTPGEFQQIPFIDAWGRHQKNPNLPIRAVNNFLNPSYVSEKNQTSADRELRRLHEEGQKGIFPQRVPQSEEITYKVGGKSESRYMNAREYTKYAETKGTLSYDIVSDMIDSPSYKAMTDEEKANAVKLAYTYAGHVAAESVDSRHDEPEYVSGYKIEQEDGTFKTVGGAENSGRELGITKAEYLLLYQEYGGKVMGKDHIEELVDTHKAGVPTRKAVEAATEAARINSKANVEKLKADGGYLKGEQQTDFDKYLDSMNLSPAERRAVNQHFGFWTIDNLSESQTEKWGKAQSIGVNEETFLKVYPIYSKQEKGYTKDKKISDMMAAGMTSGQAYAFWDAMRK